MDFNTFNKAEQSREEKYTREVEKAEAAYIDAITKAKEARDAALAKAADANLSARDGNENAFYAARAQEREAAVAEANATAGLDPSGNPLAPPKDKKPAAAKKKAAA